MHPALQAADDLFRVGLFAHLSRYVDGQLRDCTPPESKHGAMRGVALVTAVKPEIALPELQKLCRGARSSYALTTYIEVASTQQYTPEEGFCQIHFQLYDVNENKLLLDETIYRALPVLKQTVMEGKVAWLPEIDILNPAINAVAERCLRMLYAKLPTSYTNLHTAFFTQLPYDRLNVTRSARALYALKLGQMSEVPHEKITLLENALQLDPGLEGASIQLARLHKNSHQYEQSVRAYRQALEHSSASPRNKAIYATESGIACALLGRHDLAMQWWFRAIEMDAEYINPYFNIANVYEDQDDYTHAEQYFKQAQTLSPNDFRTFFNLARVYSKLGQWEFALQQYQYQLQGGDDKDPWCHSDVANCYLNLGDPEQAKKHFRHTFELDPSGEAGEYAQMILSIL